MLTEAVRTATTCYIGTTDNLSSAIAPASARAAINGWVDSRTTEASTMCSFRCLEILHDKGERCHLLNQASSLQLSLGKIHRVRSLRLVIVQRRPRN